MLIEVQSLSCVGLELPYRVVLNLGVVDRVGLGPELELKRVDHDDRPVRDA